MPPSTASLIREERDADFWFKVASHPDVRQTLLGVDPQALRHIVQLESVTPLGSCNGGFLFVRLDAFGRVQELHTLFTPEGWGREVHGAGKAALRHMFSAGADVVVTYQPQDNPRARPPLSFGFRPAAEMSDSPIGPMRTWALTRAAWEDSKGAV